MLLEEKKLNYKEIIKLIDSENLNITDELLDKMDINDLLKIHYETHLIINKISDILRECE